VASESPDQEGSDKAPEDLEQERARQATSPGAGGGKVEPEAQKDQGQKPREAGPRSDADVTTQSDAGLT
jgi:hypothetical protein